MQNQQVHDTNIVLFKATSADMADGLMVDVGVTECRRLIRPPQVGSCHPHCHHGHFWTLPLFAVLVLSGYGFTDVGVLPPWHLHS